MGETKDYSFSFSSKLYLGVFFLFFFYLGGDLMLVKVGEVLEFGEDIFSSWKGLWFTLFPFLTFLTPCRWEW